MLRRGHLSIHVHATDIACNPERTMVNEKEKEMEPKKHIISCPKNQGHIPERLTNTTTIKGGRNSSLHSRPPRLPTRHNKNTHPKPGIC